MAYESPSIAALGKFRAGRGRSRDADGGRQLPGQLTCGRAFIERPALEHLITRFRQRGNGDVAPVRFQRIARAAEQLVSEQAQLTDVRTRRVISVPERQLVIAVRSNVYERLMIHLLRDGP